MQILCVIAGTLPVCNHRSFVVAFLTSYPGAKAPQLVIISFLSSKTCNNSELQKLLMRWADIAWCLSESWGPFRWHTCHFHSPDAADSTSFDVQLGDIILTATDGLFDNMPDYMILQELKKLKVSARAYSEPQVFCPRRPSLLLPVLSERIALCYAWKTHHKVLPFGGSPANTTCEQGCWPRSAVSWTRTRAECRSSNVGRSFQSSSQEHGTDERDARETLGGQGEVFSSRHCPWPTAPTPHFICACRL